MDKLLLDLFEAYYDARRNKRNTHSQLKFELDVEHNLIELYDEIRERRYLPHPCTCFIIEDPVKREVFASDFRDRVVHHLYYNYVSPMFERMFIYDSYSCRKGKGTLFGIERIEHHIRSCSQNYRQECYVLKLDIRGYFMSIERERLKQEVLEMLEKCWKRKATKRSSYEQLLDRELIEYLTDVIISRNPLAGCKIRGSEQDWEGLPSTKSLRYAPEGFGLPIGDLTSQLFSNVYLNKLDWFVKRDLGFKHYGRYVDDFYIVDRSKKRLQGAIEQIRAFLKTELGLTLHPKKIVLRRVEEGVEFLGAVVRPYYRHVTKRTSRKFNRCWQVWDSMCRGDLSEEESKEMLASINSYLGYFQHFRMKKFLKRKNICIKFLNTQFQFVEDYKKVGKVRKDK